MIEHSGFLRFVSILSVILFIGGCQTQQKPQSTGAPGGDQAMSQQSGGSASSSAAGVLWTVPAEWTTLPEKPMRVATYGLPSAEGENEAGECAVFYFGGGGEGGDVQSNIDRWAGQFEGNPKAEQSSREVNGLKVTLVRIEGTYLAPAGPMMQSSGSKPGFRLMGAIVEAPEGSVFFKTTGPAATIEAQRANFDALIASIRKG